MEKDMLTLQELYKFICQTEKITQKPLRFKRVGKGGACCTYSGKRVYSISIDLARICIGAAYALCHEVAHQILIENDGNATHNRAFKKEEQRLVKAYANCPIARKLIF
jgi:hypothetical protein